MQAKAVIKRIHEPLSPASNYSLNSEEIRQGVTDLESRPQSVSIDLTGKCNIVPSCVFCFKGDRDSLYEPTPRARIDEILEFARASEKIRDCSLGEPLTHPDFDDVVSRICGNSQYFSFSTNGLLLTPKRIESLRPFARFLDISVSINAASPETYHHLHGRDLERTLGNVKRLIARFTDPETKAAPLVDLSMVVMRANSDEVGDFVRLAHALGANSVTLRPLAIRPSGLAPRCDFGYRFDYHHERLSPLEYNRIGKHAATVAAGLGQALHIHWEPGLCEVRQFDQAERAAPCVMPWKYLFPEDHNGDAFGCVYLGAPVGRLADQSVEEIWNGPTMVGMRQSLVKGRVPRICWLHGDGCPLVAVARTTDSGAGYFDSSRLGNRVVMGDNDEPHLDHGWHTLEHVPCAARWTGRKGSVFLSTRGRGRIHVEATTYVPKEIEERATARVEVNGVEVGRFALECATWEEFVFEVPVECDQQPLMISLVVDRPWIPAKVGVGTDYRELGIMVRKVWFAAAADTAVNCR